MECSLELFDSHAHYNDEKFNNDRKEVIESLYQSGITKIVNAGYSLKSSIDAINLAKEYKYIYTTVGISPNDLNENWEDDVNQIDLILAKELVKSKNNKIVAMGEIGLDYHYDINKEWQKQAFTKQINIANKYSLPIVIHTRDAVMDTLNILKENTANEKGIFHCCPFNRELVKEALKLGFYISISGTVTFKNAANAQEIVNMVPLDKLLIETDSPYLAPEPVRGSRNDSRNLCHVISKIAEFKKIDVQELARQTYKNAETIYKIKN